MFCRKFTAFWCILLMKEVLHFLTSWFRNCTTVIPDHSSTSVSYMWCCLGYRMIECCHSSSLGLQVFLVPSLPGFSAFPSLWSRPHLYLLPHRLIPPVTYHSLDHSLFNTVHSALFVSSFLVDSLSSLLLIIVHLVVLWRPLTVSSLHSPSLFGLLPTPLLTCKLVWFLVWAFTIHPLLLPG